jgi:hypothetical protein
LTKAQAFAIKYITKEGVMAVLELSSFKMIEKADILGDSQCVLAFGDEYELSIISGQGAFSTKNAPYEIAVIKNGDLVEMPGITDKDDTVKGYLTEDDVGAIIKKMYFLTGKSPRQI